MSFEDKVREELAFQQKHWSERAESDAKNFVDAIKCVLDHKEQLSLASCYCLLYHLITAIEAIETKYRARIDSVSQIHMKVRESYGAELQLKLGDAHRRVEAFKKQLARGSIEHKECVELINECNYYLDVLKGKKRREKTDSVLYQEISSFINKCNLLTNKQQE